MSSEAAGVIIEEKAKKSTASEAATVATTKGQQRTAVPRTPSPPPPPPPPSKAFKTTSKKEEGNKENKDKDNDNGAAAAAANNIPQSNSTQPQQRRSKRVLEQDPIIAPGYGTRKDLLRLTAELGHALPYEAVEAVMKSRGRGIRSSSRGKNGGDDSAVAAANNGAKAAAAKAAPDISMWDDFMQEGMASSEPVSKKAKTQESSATKSSAHRAAEMDKNKDNKDDDDRKPSAATSESEETGPRSYTLPLEWPALEETATTTTSTTTTSASKKKATTANNTKAVDAVGAAKEKGGLLLQAGTLDAAIVGRTKIKPANAGSLYNCPVPTRLLPDIVVRQVFTSCNAVHSFCVTTDGKTYAWGRNENHQLGLGAGDARKNVVYPTPALESLPSPLRQAACGKSHSVFLLQDHTLWAVGSNKSGQCGVKNFTDVSAVKKCVVPDGVFIAQVACGEDFTMAVTTAGHLYSCGSSQYGQLGNGVTGEYFVAANKLAFTNANVLERRSVFCHVPNEKLHSNNDTTGKVVPLPDSDHILVQQVTCGKHHTTVLEAASEDGRRPRVWSFGCGDYGCLGHGAQRDEYFPRLIGIIEKLPLGASGNGGGVEFDVLNGAHCSLLRTHSNGHVYYWGKHKSAGEAVMRPQLVDALANNQHFVTRMAAGGQTVICSTRLGQTVAWGQGPHGELGLGKARSSSKPTFVESLDKIPVLSVAAAYGHTLFVIDSSLLENSVIQKIPVVEKEDVEALN